MTHDLLTYALNYARAGWPVCPCAPLRRIGRNAWICACLDAEKCRRPGKHPWAPAVRNGLSDASTSENQVKAWWSRWPRANIALVCGRPGGRWVLDVDGDVGAASLERLEAEHGPLPTTLEARTGSGGRHLVFEWPGRKVVTRQGFPEVGLDVRGDGGYICAAPSAHVSGGTYAWVNEAPVRMAPVWLLELVMEAPQPVEVPRPQPSFVDGNRQLARARAYARAYPGAISGQNGHTVTFTLAVHIVRGFALAPELALRVLLEEFNGRCRPAWSVRELNHKVDDATRSKEPLGYLLERGRR
jgi:Bifunctional DNA primase/polymerase, N-terminal